ncbi:hypothetical protein HHI36_014989, partial [Cryptolaemus montrouzieri]
MIRKTVKIRAEKRIEQEGEVDDVHLHEKMMAYLKLEYEEADGVQIIPQQNASSDVESQVEANNG